MSLYLVRNYIKKMPLGMKRILINWWPPLLAAGIHIQKISPDFRSIEVILKMHWYNKNYVGTHFGGSIFAMTDPFYMLMLIQNLGEGYIVWDKAARIDFIKPGIGTLHANFNLSEDTLKQVYENTRENQKYIFDLPIDILNDEGTLIASVVRTLYVRPKAAFSTPPADSSAPAHPQA